MLNSDSTLTFQVGFMNSQEAATNSWPSIWSYMAVPIKKTNLPTTTIYYFIKKNTANAGGGAINFLENPSLYQEYKALSTKEAINKINKDIESKLSTTSVSFLGINLNTQIITTFGPAFIVTLTFFLLIHALSLQEAVYRKSDKEDYNEIIDEIRTFPIVITSQNYFFSILSFIFYVALPSFTILLTYHMWIHQYNPDKWWLYYMMAVSQFLLGFLCLRTIRKTLTSTPPATLSPRPQWPGV